MYCVERQAYIEPSDYAFKVPTASSIRRRGTFEETLSAIIDANESRPARKRLPMEILLLVNKELHTTESIYEEIRSAWEPFSSGDTFGGNCLENVLLDKRQNSFFCSKVPFYLLINRTDVDTISGSFSSADLLYRVRCFFPEIPVFSSRRAGGDKCIWSARIRHKRTGIDFMPNEHKATAQLIGIHSDENTEKTIEDFIKDAIRLCNALFETEDGTRFAYFHPAAYADAPTANERFPAVPGSDRARLLTRRVELYIPWDPVPLSVAELSSSKSLLADLKYNVKSRQVDTVNGAENLTTIISSSLLFYRLLCYYVWNYSNVNVTPPITSVWQVKLEHRKNGASVIFMDDHGLFDIRAGEDAKEVMDDIVALVTALCSDECSHPYAGIVAGCAV